MNFRLDDKLYFYILYYLTFHSLNVLWEGLRAGRGWEWSIRYDLYSYNDPNYIFTTFILKKIWPLFLQKSDLYSYKNPISIFTKIWPLFLQRSDLYFYKDRPLFLQRSDLYFYKDLTSILTKIWLLPILIDIRPIFLQRSDSYSYRYPTYILTKIWLLFL